MTELEQYYNKFNEDKRLSSRHGQVEFVTSMKYIHKYLDYVKARFSPANCQEDEMDNKEAENIDIESKEAECSDTKSKEAECSDAKSKEAVNRKSVNSQIKILDIGAATGGYSIPLANEGYDVTAVELVRHNLGILKKKCEKVKAYQGNAMKLSKFADETFDLTLLFGPMYHLHLKEEKEKALKEAARVTKKGGIILVAYIMNEYSVITYAFKEKNISEALKTGMLDENYHCTEIANPLYSFVRLEDIQSINDEVSKQIAIQRKQIISADGAANYIRPFLNALTEDDFKHFIEYHLATCERMDLMGAAGHTVDILERL